MNTIGSITTNIPNAKSPESSNETSINSPIASDWNTNRTSFPVGDFRRKLFGTPRKESMVRLARSTPPGCFVELGVYQGGSAYYLYKLAIEQDRQCHLFDTFNGIPEHTGGIDIIPVGHLGNVELERLRLMMPTAIFHVGIFPKTMANVGPIAFAHIDCDQYRSYLEAIDHFWPLMVEQGIMLFDDYNVTPGAKLAVHERFDSLRFTREGKAYVVK